VKNWILTVEDLLARHLLGTLAESEIYKFVRVGDTYRFAEIVMIGCPKHCDLVEEGEGATSAGNICVSSDSWRMLQWYSQTLGVHATPEDEEALTALLLRPVKR